MGFPRDLDEPRWTPAPPTLRLTVAAGITEASDLDRMLRAAQTLTTNNGADGSRTRRRRLLCETGPIADQWQIR